MLIIDNDAEHPHEIAVNRFRDSIHPRGYQYLRHFNFGDTAEWHFDVTGVKVVKQVLVPWQRNAVGVRYTIDTAGRDVEFRAWPFFSMRDFHTTRHANGYDLPAESTEDSVSVAVDATSLRVACDAATFSSERSWWYGHVYPIETDRGQDDSEDLFTPGRFTAKLKGKSTLTFWATTEPDARFDWDAELARRQKVTDASAPTTAMRKLTRAANDFVVYRKAQGARDGTSIIAGYPWFADWGRDTMISLPGLLLVPRRFDRAKEVLTVFAEYVSEGMIPNRFDDYTNQPHYNTVDASLWFVHACHEYARLSNDSKTFESLLKPACRAILDGYRRGTRFKIRMDESDALVTQGDEHTQLTWMDAKCGDVAFTPRQGKAVEINALWYHALVLMGEKDLAAKAKENFQKAFWVSPFRGLADVVNGNPQQGYQRDNSIRPNQIYAVSLPNSPLTRDQQSTVVEVVRRELLTPVGLRTLAKGDPKYCHLYRGDQYTRDSAYHNGTIWPWLIGGFLEAYLRVNDRSADALAQARRWLSPLIDALDDNCLGQIAEIYEAEDPHRPVGCPAQAWSVAEVLRIAAQLEM
jgi:predicted glycogen debranching enzyme